MSNSWKPEWQSRVFQRAGPLLLSRWRSDYSLESLCWHSPGLGQRSRPINLRQPLNSLKLLKCGVQVTGESRLTWNLVSVAGSDKDLWDPEFWWVWVEQCQVSARGPVARFICSTVWDQWQPKNRCPGVGLCFLTCGKGAARAAVCDLCSRDSSLK